MDRLPVFIYVSKRNVDKGLFTVISIEKYCTKELDVCFFAEDLSPLQKEDIYSLERKGINIRVIDGSNYTDKLCTEWHGIFYIPELFYDYQKVLCISPEMIACADISPLWEIEMGHHVIAAVKQLQNNLIKRRIEELFGKKSSMYVNTDVMLINRTIFLKKRSRLIIAAEQHSEVSHSMSDTVNFAFTGNILQLPVVWNCPFEPEFWDSRNEFLLAGDQKRYGESKYHPNIMNYSGLHKPWNYAENPSSAYYFSALQEQESAHRRFFLYTIITTAYNCGRYLNHYFESICSQTIGFSENIQIIFVDDGSTDETERICRQYVNRFPENIVYCSSQHRGILQARNEAIKHGAGEYFYFLDADDYLPADFFEKVREAQHVLQDSVSVFGVPVTYVEGSRETRLRQQFGREPFCILDLYTDYGIGINSISSFLFSGERISAFDEEKSVRAAEIEFIQNQLKDEHEIGWVNQVQLFSRVRRDGTAYLSLFWENREALKQYFQVFWKQLLEMYALQKKCIPYYMQYSLVEELICFLSLQSKTDGGDEPDVSISPFFWEMVQPVLQKIEDFILIDALGMHDMSRILFIMAKKYGKSPNVRLIKDDAEIFLENTVVGMTSYQSILLHFVKIEDGILLIEGESAAPVCLGRQATEVQVEVNSMLFKAEMTERTVDKVLLGECYEYGGTFSFRYPLQGIPRLRLRFFLQVENVNIAYHAVIGLRFSPVSNEVKNAYAVREGYALWIEGDSLYCQWADERRQQELEDCYQKSLKSEKDPKAVRASRFRRHLNYLRKKKKSPVWLFFDRIDKADDNGEAMFRYVCKNCPDIESYFVIGKECEDYNRLQQVGKVIPANSVKHQLLFSLADCVLTSQLNGFVENPFGQGEKYYRDLLHTQKVIFLQHGITKDDQTKWLNRFNQDLKALVTSCKRETDSILEGAYYYNRDQIWMTGMPRFDRLYHAEKRYILIMPTWRKRFMEQRWNSEAGVYRWEPCEGFAESEYCRAYSSLLQNKRLTAACKQYGYQLVFMVHPIVQPYQSSFTIPEEVLTFPYETSWRELFAWSDLMVTDYSSVAFDFAYLRKPVLYYQFDRESFFSGHAYSEGYFRYVEDGFGEVAENEERLVTLLEQYIQNCCNLKPIYENRINEFYEYRDTENCSRLMERICRDRK